MAKAAAANELLVRSSTKRATRGRSPCAPSPGGQIWWTETFLAPVEAGDLLQLAKQVDKSLLRGYKDRRPRRESRLEARTETTPRSCRQAAARCGPSVSGRPGAPTGDDSPPPPGCPPPRGRRPADRFQSTKKVVLPRQGSELVRGAASLTGRSRPLFTQFTIELDQPGRGQTLARIERLLPGDPRVLISGPTSRTGRAQDEALDDLRTAVQSSRAGATS